MTRETMFRIQKVCMTITVIAGLVTMFFQIRSLMLLRETRIMLESMGAGK